EPADVDRAGLLAHRDDAEQPPRPATDQATWSVVEDADAVLIGGGNAAGEVVGHGEVVEVAARLVLHSQLHALHRSAGPVLEGDAELLLFKSSDPEPHRAKRGQYPRSNDQDAGHGPGPTRLQQRARHGRSPREEGEDTHDYPGSAASLQVPGSA